MRLFEIFILLIVVINHCFGQDQKIVEQYYEALSYSTFSNEYLKSDSLLKALTSELKSFEEPDYYVYSLFYRGVCHIQVKDYNTALDIMFQALEESKSVKGGCDYYLLASIYYGLSDIFYHFGYFELSEYYISHCSDYLDISETYSYIPGLCQAKQGYLSYLVGDYYGAVQYFDIAINLSEQKDSSPLQWAAVKSLCHANLKNFEEATRAIGIIKSESIEKFPKASYTLSYVLAREIEIKLLNRDTHSVKLLLDSISVLTNDQQLKLNYYLSSVKYYQLTNQIDSVNSFVDLALDHATTNLSYNKYKVAETYLKSSKIKFQNSDFKIALNHILEAEKILTEKKIIIPNEDSYTSFNARLLLQVLLHKSRIQFELNAKDDLTTTANRILKLLDVFLDQHLGLPESKFLFLKRLKLQFEQMITDCIELEENELAFLISQKLHGNLLALEIKKNIALDNYDLPFGYVDFENQLKIGINKREIKLSQIEHGTSAFDSISTDLVHSRTELKKLTASIENSNPGYYALKYSSPKAKSVSEIQSKLLKRNSALIEYFLGETQLYTFVITHNNLKIIQKDIDSVFLTHFKNQNNHLRTLLDSPVDYKQFVESSEYLYSVLLADVFNILGSKVKNLYVIPDGLISYIPFGSLFAQCPKEALENRYDLLPFLAREYNFFYHYSSGLLDGKQGEISPQFAGFAPDFNNYAPKYNLSDLTYNAKEVESIGQISSGIINLETSANLFNVLESFKNEGILHLATHAESNDTLPLLSRIFLQDGPLHAYEIYNSQNKLDLAVLSACETGSGVLQVGEGIMSLARSFLSSGCETIITSLWKVNDKNSVSIMQSFYGHLFKGQSIGNSLAQAKREYLKNTNSALQAHPYNWATFISIGNPNQTFTKFDWYKLLFAISIFCLTVLLWKRI